MNVAGFPSALSFTGALTLAAVCGLTRGPLRYGEQMCNHYLAFKLLALVCDQVFGALRRLAPAKLEGRDKGDLVSLVTADIELLEVFYAPTLSPVVIALIVSVAMVAFFGSIDPAFAWMGALSYLIVGVSLPWVGSKASSNAGRALVALTAFMSSFGPVIAVANLGTTLQQTLASGARVLELLREEPQTREVTDGVGLAAFTAAVADRTITVEHGSGS